MGHIKLEDYAAVKTQGVWKSNSNMRNAKKDSEFHVLLKITEEKYKRKHIKINAALMLLMEFFIL